MKQPFLTLRSMRAEACICAYRKAGRAALQTSTSIVL